MINKLLKIFKVKSIFQLLIIFIVFGITGSLSVILGDPILNKFAGEDIVNKEYYWILRLILIFPLYQVLLIIVGTIFGQFKYFWEIEKKILIRIGLLKSPRS